LAASTLESEVESVLEQLLAAGEVPGFEQVRPRLESSRPQTPEMEPLRVELDEYNALLSQEVAS
jgi:hypothetical protein